MRSLLFLSALMVQTGWTTNIHTFNTYQNLANNQNKVDNRTTQKKQFEPFSGEGTKIGGGTYQKTSKNNLNQNPSVVSPKKSNALLEKRKKAQNVTEKIGSRPEWNFNADISSDSTITFASKKENQPSLLEQTKQIKAPVVKKEVTGKITSTGGWDARGTTEENIHSNRDQALENAIQIRDYVGVIKKKGGANTEEESEWREAYRMDGVYDPDATARIDAKIYKKFKDREDRENTIQGQIKNREEELENVTVERKRLESELAEFQQKSKQESKNKKDTRKKTLVEKIIENNMASLLKIEEKIKTEIEKLKEKSKSKKSSRRT